MKDTVYVKQNGRLSLSLSKIGEIADKYQYWIVAIIVIAALVVRFVYVFQFTQFKNYLYSDMGAYWEMALERVKGNDVSIGQWIIWPPFYHIALSYFIRLIDFFGLADFRLEIVKGCDIILGSLSLLFLYGLTKKIAKGNPVPALIVSAAYSFCYPIIYLNAFVLTENLAIPLLIFSTWCIFKVSPMRDQDSEAGGSGGRRRIRFLSIPLIDFLWIFLSGLSLAIATAARPAFGLLGLLFVLFLTGVMVFRVRAIFKEKDIRREAFSRLAKAAFFSLVFFAFLGLVMLENMRISGGKLAGLGAGGGFNFYLAQSKKYWLETNFNGYRYILVPPGTVDQPERGKFITDVPFYDQAYYYSLGWQYLKGHPEMLLKNLLSFETLFFGPLFPSDASAQWFVELIPIFKMKLFIMAVSILILLPFMLKNPLLRSRYFFFILALPFCLLSLNLIYNVEQRYLYSFAFILYILFVFAVFSFFQAKGRRLVLRIVYYAGVLAFILAAPPLVKEIRAHTLPDTVRATLTQCEGYIPSFDFDKPPPQGPSPFYSLTTCVNSVRFRGPGPLIHEDKGKIGDFNYDFFGVFESSFHVRESGTYVFKVFADDAARLIIDGVLVGEAKWNQEDGYGTIDFTKLMEKDTVHKIVIEYIEEDGNLSLISTYQKTGTDDEDYHYVGENSPYIYFDIFPK
jgi:hypothetical protein